MYSISASDSLIGKTIYVYDEENNLTEENEYNSLGEITQTIRYFHDEQGRIIQKNRIYWDPRHGTIPRLREQLDYEYF